MMETSAVVMDCGFDMGKRTHDRTLTELSGPDGEAAASEAVTASERSRPGARMYLFAKARDGTFGIQRDAGHFGLPVFFFLSVQGNFD